ncbi:MAG: phosphate transport system protein [Chlamydiales bacterium]|jgi:phosphate transport system protein
MTEHLTRDLQEIKRNVLGMAGCAEEALGLALAAYSRREEVPARRLAQAEERIDRLQLEIDDQIIKCLALHQPVASDLRFVTSAMRIVNDLERIGDHTTSISERLIYIVNQEPLGEPVEIEAMMRGAAAMLRDGLNSFVDQDPDLARDVLKRDDAIDEYNRQHFVILIERMKRDPSSIEVAVSMLSISRGLERIADLATNIAEDVVYMVDAKDIRHPGVGARPRPMRSEDVSPD